MKKYFFMVSAFAFVGLAAFGAWKYQAHKKLPWFQDRTPASATEEMDLHAAEDESLVEQVSEQVAEEVVKEDMKIKLVQAKPSKKLAQKPVVKTTQKNKVLAFSQDSVKHTVTKDETAWFLANVYYGRGQEFTKILSANGYQSANELREGKEILIPNPQFHKGQSTFAAHYSELWEKRAKALKERDKQVEADKYMSREPLPTSKVVIPTEKIRAKDSVSQYPFTEVKDPHHSPAEAAKKVLRQAGEYQGE